MHCVGSRREQVDSRADFDTMMRCYDIPEDADVLAVTSEPRKRREASAARAN